MQSRTAVTAGAVTVASAEQSATPLIEEKKEID
jgi:hypothetical protein